MRKYHVYEKGGENTQHAGRSTLHEAFEAATARRALAAFDPPGGIEVNSDDDTAWSRYPDHQKRGGLEHVMCADWLY